MSTNFSELDSRLSLLLPSSNSFTFSEWRIVVHRSSQVGNTVFVVFFPLLRLKIERMFSLTNTFICTLSLSLLLYFRWCTSSWEESGEQSLDFTHWRLYYLHFTYSSFEIWAKFTTAAAGTTKMFGWKKTCRRMLGCLLCYFLYSLPCVCIWLMWFWVGCVVVYWEEAYAVKKWSQSAGGWEFFSNCTESNNKFNSDCVGWLVGCSAKRGTEKVQFPQYVYPSCHPGSGCQDFILSLFGLIEDL